ncbi:PREDICTED: WAT1-related protein At3g30340 [Tarenaya hassleriana]|uniref:WAT1-related protein At3g30340 n=1 Tax=Tarenaya hassleriana TaxID=28532 RepID=UPI00053C46FB|nr:PREDICTED: WAT1-related protein At3g30340 [Tarenaya hassleriana]
MRCDSKLWKAVIIMTMVNFGLGMVNVLFKKMLNEGINRMVATTYRLITGTVFLVPFAVLLERQNWSKLNTNVLCLLFLSALLGTSLVQYFFLLGLEYTSSAFALAFGNMVPSVTFVIALVFRQETVNIKNNAGRAKVIGSMVCISGALLLTFYKGTQLTENLQTQNAIASTASPNAVHKWTLGSIMLIVAIALWSSWFIVQAKISQKFPSQYTSTTILSFFGAIQSALLSLISERSLKMWILKERFQILALLYSGITGSGLCYVAMSWCLRQRGPVFTSAFIPLIQVFAAIFSFSFLHEQFYLGSVIGSLVVIVGLYILLWGKSKDNSEPVTKQGQLARGVDGHETVLKEIAVADSVCGK